MFRVPRLSVIHFVLAAILATSIVQIGFARDIRDWTSADGTRTIQAEFLGGEEGFVRLRLKEGKEMRARLSLFSVQDQKFVREMVARSSTLAVDNLASSIESPANVLADKHILADHFRPGALLNGRFNVRNLETWDSRLELIGVKGKEFDGLLHLDTVRNQVGITSVNASVRVRGELDGRRGLEFTVTRIEKQSPRQDCFIDSNNIGIVYRGLATDNRIVGRALPSGKRAGGSVSFMFMHPKLSVPLVAQPSGKPTKVAHSHIDSDDESNTIRTRLATREREVLEQPSVDSTTEKALDRWPD